MSTRWIKFLFLVGVAMLIHARPPETSVKIYYIPFDVQTYEPVSADNIDNQAFIVISMRRDWISEEILSCITPTTPISMDKKGVRLKIIIKNDVYLFDANGNGVMNHKRAVFLNTNKIGHILSAKKVVIPMGPVTLE